MQPAQPVRLVDHSRINAGGPRGARLQPLEFRLHACHPPRLRRDYNRTYDINALNMRPFHAAVQEAAQ